MSLIIQSFCDHEGVGCFSEIIDTQSSFRCVAVEQPWKDNRPFVSCIPAGDYELVPFSSNKFGDTFAFHNPELNVYAQMEDRVDNNQRYACLFHAANRFDQLQGCLAPGSSLGYIPMADKPNVWGVRKSKRALEALLPLLAKYKAVTVIRPFQGHGYSG